MGVTLMAILSDITIKACIKAGYIGIDPYVEDNVQPASIDLRLGREFRWFGDVVGAQHVIDPREQQEMRTSDTFTEDDAFVLLPGQFALGTTIERVRLSASIVGRLEGKSSLGRLGLTVHSTAGFFDPGFEGTATLEFFNMTNSPIRLIPGMKVCQMSFHRMTTPAERPYGSKGLGSKYQGQDGTVPSKMHENWKDE